MAPVCQTRGNDKSYVTQFSPTRQAYNMYGVVITQNKSTEKQQKGLDIPMPDRAPYSPTSRTPIDLKPARIAGLGDAMGAHPVDQPPCV